MGRTGIDIDRCRVPASASPVSSRINGRSSGRGGRRGCLLNYINHWRIDQLFGSYRSSPLFDYPVFAFAISPGKVFRTFSRELSVAFLTLITVSTTFFGWNYDQTILLIPIAEVFAWLNRSRYKRHVIACIACAIIINYYQRFLVINDTYYVWVPLFWWVFFGIVWRDALVMGNHHVYSKLQSFIDYRSR